MSEKNDVYPYRRIGDNPFLAGRPARKRGSSGLNPAGVLAGIAGPGMLLASAVGFFLGRAVILGDLIPFAPAFAAAAGAAFGRRGILVIALLCAGIFTVTGGYLLAADIVLALLSFLFAQAVPPKYSGQRAIFPAIVFGLTLSVKSGFSAFTGSTPYDYISIFFEAVLAGSLTPACAASFFSVRKLTGIKPLAAEETVCLLVIAAGVIAGTGDIKFWYISAKGLLSRTVILLASLAGGAGMGAAAGAVVGVIPGFSYTATPYLVGAYSFSGLMAGLGLSLGKMGVALSFLASNIILAIYFDNLAGMAPVIAETALACLGFLLVPESFVRRISSAVMRDADPGRPEGGGHIEEALRGRVRDFADIFRGLAGAFGENTVVTEKNDNEQGIKQLLGDISRKVCDGCGMYHVCWEKDYYRTYQNMLDMFTLSEMYGRVKISDMPEDLKLRCTRSRELLITASCLYEAFKQGRHWQRKISAVKGIVGDQLRGVSAVVENLAGEFRFGAGQVNDSDEELKQKLRQIGLPVRELNIVEIPGGKKEIILAMKSCRGNLDCRYRVAPLVSDFLGQLFSATGCVCEGTEKAGYCRFRLYQGPQYRVEVGAAGAPRDGSQVSGDSFDFLQLPEGRFAAVLSDGMGSGERAARESAAVLEIMKKMLEAGVEMETAIKSLNAVLALKSNDDSFATLDMVIINLYSGQGEFIKIGPPPTFLVRGGKVRAVRGDSLPVGVLSDIDICLTEKKLASGDVIVMMTDGVLEAYKGSSDREEWVTGVLEELNGLDPMEMAELMLKLAGTPGEKQRTPDDMTVLVVRVEKERVVEMPR